MHDLSRIMFVEDDPDIFPLINLSLSTLGGFEAHGFASGKEALAKAADVDPQLILLDVMMPDMDGPATFTNLRNLPGFETKPIVFMTAKVNESDVNRLLALGATDVVSKPFDPMTLADDVRKIWLQNRTRS